MGRLTTGALRVVLALVLGGSLFVQAVMLPVVYLDLDDAGRAARDLRIPALSIVLAGIVCCQVVLVCTWRLLTLVRRGTVFSPASFRFVDIIIGAVAFAALLLVGLGGLLAPGEEVAPGVVLLLGGAGLTVAGIALVIVVMRALLVQAVARDREAVHLRAELDEVI
ncbi:DUF2975 domain-containing protein [Nocardioides sambongensis]|uniref:DUF2975 domain-containing protein n=1 Tax=Nocardioides sambongensis TaxID=2589074 RepID=UPI00112EDB23|nr:DUF2975 domain-containing protein [Nocardioides sambongensis]